MGKENTPFMGSEHHNDDRTRFTFGNLLHAAKEVFMGSPLSFMLLFVPFSFLSNYLSWSPTLTFAASFLALIPLAAVLGDITEEVSRHTNQVLAGLLNATFGNATELIISIFALKRDLTSVIKASLLGSVLGNMLLVLGSALFVAGIRHSRFQFNQRGADAYGTLLLVALLGLLVPTMFNILSDPDTNAETLAISRVAAVLLCIGYCGYLYFQLVTHREMFEEIDPKHEGEEEAQMPAAVAVALLASVTVLISFCSEFLVDSIEPTAQALNLSFNFIGVILIPIVGNVAEHAAAIVMAYRGKLDISVSIAVGSSIQIALFVVPVLVLVSWAFGKTLDLDFHPLSSLVLVMSVMIVKNIIGDGESNWFEGFLLLLCYILLAVSYVLLPGDFSA